MAESRDVQAPGGLLEFLFQAWPETKKKQIRLYLKHRIVSVNGRTVTRFDHPLQPGDRVALHDRTAVTANTSLSSGLKIVHEDAEIIVIEKPAGLLTMASEGERDKTAYFQVTHYLRKGGRTRDRVWIVHRLDRETSGLLVLAKTEKAKYFLQDHWEKAEKKYQAMVEGAPPAEHGTLISYLNEENPLRVLAVPAGEGARRAVTHYRVVQKNAKRSLVELVLETGRRHQLRVQLSEAGCPIVGDEKYGAARAERMALHACELSFPHPLDGRMMRFRSILRSGVFALGPKVG